MCCHNRANYHLFSTKLSMRTGLRGFLQSRLELTMDRNDLATHEGNGPRWKYPRQGSAFPVL